MPKLNSALAAQVERQEVQINYEPIPAGTYVVRLMNVEPRESKNGNPAWSWTYEIVEGEHTGRRLWDYTSLVEKALWRVKAIFDAFEVPPGTDTDELLGRQVRLVVSQRPIPAGQRAGEIGNQIDRVLPGPALSEASVGKETASMF